MREAPPIPTNGAIWDLVFSRSGHEVYVDRASIQRVGREQRVWLRIERPFDAEPSNGWPAYRSSLELRRCDCRARSAAIEQLIVFGLTGAAGPALRAATWPDTALEKPPPDSVGEAVLLALCRATH